MKVKMSSTRKLSMDDISRVAPGMPDDVKGRCLRLVNSLVVSYPEPAEVDKRERTRLQGEYMRLDLQDVVSSIRYVIKRNMSSFLSMSSTELDENGEECKVLDSNIGEHYAYNMLREAGFMKSVETMPTRFMDVFNRCYVDYTTKHMDMETFVTEFASYLMYRYVYKTEREAREYAEKVIKEEMAKK